MNPLGPLPLPILAESPLFGLFLFAVFFALFVLAFCRGNVGRFVGGLLRLVASIFSAPVRYLHAAALRVADYSRPNLDYRQDRQYLTQTLLLISNAAILLVAIGTLAGGGVASWRVFVPGGIQEERRQAAEAIPGAEKELAELEKRLAEVTAQLGTQTPQEKQLDDLRKQLAEARQKVSSGRDALDAAQPSHWPPVRQHLEQNDGASSEWEIDRVRGAIFNFLDNQGSAEATAQVRAHVETWVHVRQLQRQIAPLERNNPRAGLQREKASLEESVARQKQQVETLREQAGLGRLLKELRPGLALLTMLMSVLAMLGFVWFAGLVVEWTGLFVDMAMNLRKLREAGGR